MCLPVLFQIRVACTNACDVRRKQLSAYFDCLFWVGCTHFGAVGFFPDVGATHRVLRICIRANSVYEDFMCNCDNVVRQDHMLECREYCQDDTLIIVTAERAI